MSVPSGRCSSFGLSQYASPHRSHAPSTAPTPTAARAASTGPSRPAITASAPSDRAPRRRCRARRPSALPRGVVSFFQNGACGLQVVHHELARRERLAAMRARDHDQHDLVGRLAASPTRWITSTSYEVPARPRLLDDAGQRLLGHARIVLERHRRDVGAFVQVAHDADEARDGADLRIAGAQARDLGADVEVLVSGRGPASQPPPGRLKAAERPPGGSERSERGGPSRSAAGHRRKERHFGVRRAVRRSSLAISWSTAALTRRVSANAVVQARRAPRSQRAARRPGRRRPARRPSPRIAPTRSRSAAKYSTRTLHDSSSEYGRKRTASPRRIDCPAGLSTRPSRPHRRGQHRRVLVAEQFERAARVHPRAQELAARVGLRPGRSRRAA